MTPVTLRLGDVLRLRKPHPCGNHDFTVVRLGADIGLRCTVCSRRIMLPRPLLEGRITDFVSRGEQRAMPNDIEPTPELPSSSTTPPHDPNPLP